MLRLVLCILWDHMRIKASFGRNCCTRLCGGVKNKPWSLFSIPLVINWRPMSSSPEANLQKANMQKEGKIRTKQLFLATWWIFCQMSVGLCCLEIHYLLLMANLLAVFSHWQSDKLVWRRKGQVITNACSHIPSCQSQQSRFGQPLKCLTDFSPDLLLDLPEPNERLFAPKCRRPYPWPLQTGVCQVTSANGWLPKTWTRRATFPSKWLSLNVLLFRRPTYLMSSSECC